MSVVPDSGGSLLRADGQVIWFPPRSAAEHLDPAHFHVLNLSASVLNPKPHTVRRVVTSVAVIARLVRLLNGFPAAPDLIMSCRAIPARYRLAFAASAGSPPQAVVTVDGCRIDDIRISGNPQPALYETGGKLFQVVRQLLPVKPLY